MIDPEHVRNLVSAGNIRRRHKVESSMIDDIGYDPHARVLEVRFKNNGAIYRYPSIDAGKAATLLNAESIGEYFTRFIKDQPCCPWHGHSKKESKSNEPSFPT